MLLILVGRALLRDDDGESQSVLREVSGEAAQILATDIDEMPVASPSGLGAGTSGTEGLWRRLASKRPAWTALCNDPSTFD
jgi:hypothetical protein